MIYLGRYRPIVLFSAPLAGPASHALAPRMRPTGDVSDLGGAGRIAGSVRVDSTPDYPVRRRVRLFDRRDNRLVRDAWSDPATGAYAFEHINPARTYVVVAYDHTGVFNAEIRDNVTPEAMP